MIRDTRMMERALTQRWPIKPEYRELIVKRMLRIIADPKSSPREVTSATKALLAAESQNQADEHKVVDLHVSTRHDQLDAIAADLGIEISLISNAEGKGVSSNIRDEGEQ
jgi:hypothetical protein